ncbi:organic solvent tolerance protein OstA, partial [Campylobacter coli]|nr:organic solvent tolerance protein OstA [Campylobacter coli]
MVRKIILFLMSISISLASQIEVKALNF